MKRLGVMSSCAVLLLAAASAVFLTACGNDSSGSGAAGAKDTSGPVPDNMSTLKPGEAWTPPKFAELQAPRDAMASWINTYYKLEDEAVINAMRSVPRHEFVPADIKEKAYDDSTLPIPYGQLISQPWIVARMTHELHLTKDSKVLEIGTGSGYQAAILTQFTPQVYSIEIIKPLGLAAAERERRLGYTCINLRIGDGYNGWVEAAPFDAIIVTCAAGQIPPPLIKQLKKGGRMMIPVGPPFQLQSLMLVEKDEQGEITSQSLEPVKFVPLLSTDPTANGK